MRVQSTSKETFIEKFKHPFKVIAKVSTPPPQTPHPPYKGNINHTGVQNSLIQQKFQIIWILHAQCGEVL